MPKSEYQFVDFLANVNPDCKDAVVIIHDTLTGDGYKTKIESKSNGFFVSYSHPKTKRSMLNLLFRKKGLIARIYGDNIGKYPEFLDSLPENMEKEIGKAGTCKRLIDPQDCNPRCVKGYDFFVRGNRYQKCRYSCFQFTMSPESIPAITEFIEKERAARLV